VAVPSVTSMLQGVRASFSASFGNVVFGVAASAANSRVVLLAGATGAAAAAIAMMAGTYLDALSTRGQAQARIVSISITAILLLLLGVARGIVAKSSILRGALETLGIATAAAITGYFIGKLVTL